MELGNLLRLLATICALVALGFQLSGKHKECSATLNLEAIILWIIIIYKL